MDLIRSGLLKDADQQKIKRAIPKASNKVIDSAVARLYVAHPDPAQWTWTGLMGAICLVDDLVGHTWYLKLVDIEGNLGVLWDQELYVDFEYRQDRTFFHSFDLEQCQAGLLFEDRHEAAHFIKRVQQRQKHGSKATNQNKQGLVRADAQSAHMPPPVPAAPTAINTGFKTRVKTQAYYDDEIPAAWKELYQLLFDRGVTEDMIAANTDFIKEYIREYGGPLSGLEPPVHRRFSARAAISAPAAPTAAPAAAPSSRRAPPPPPPPPTQAEDSGASTSPAPETPTPEAPTAPAAPAARPVPPAVPSQRNVPPAPAPRISQAPAAPPRAVPAAPAPRTVPAAPASRPVPAPPPRAAPVAVPVAAPMGAPAGPSPPPRTVPAPPAAPPAAPQNAPPPPQRAPVAAPAPLVVPPKAPAPPQRASVPAPVPAAPSPPVAVPTPPAPPAAPAAPPAPPMAPPSATPAPAAPAPAADPGFNALMASITQAGGSSSLRKTGKNPANTPGAEDPAAVAAAPPRAAPAAPPAPPRAAPGAHAPPAAPPAPPRAVPAAPAPPAPAPPAAPAADAPPAATSAAEAPHNALMAAITQSSTANLKKTDKSHLERPSVLEQSHAEPASAGAPNMASAIAAALSQRRKGVQGSDDEEDDGDWD